MEETRTGYSKEEVDAKFAALELAMKQGTETLKQYTETLKQMTETLKQDTELMLKQVDEMDKRVDVLYKKSDNVYEYIAFAETKRIELELHLGYIDDKPPTKFQKLMKNEAW